MSFEKFIHSCCPAFVLSEVPDEHHYVGEILWAFKILLEGNVHPAWRGWTRDILQNWQKQIITTQTEFEKKNLHHKNLIWLQNDGSYKKGISFQINRYFVGSLKSWNFHINSSIIDGPATCDAFPSWSSPSRSVACIPWAQGLGKLLQTVAPNKPTLQMRRFIYPEVGLWTKNNYQLPFRISCLSNSFFTIHFYATFPSYSTCSCITTYHSQNKHPAEPFSPLKKAKPRFLFSFPSNVALTNWKNSHSLVPTLLGSTGILSTKPGAFSEKLPHKWRCQSRSCGWLGSHLWVKMIISSASMTGWEVQHGTTELNCKENPWLWWKDSWKDCYRSMDGETHAWTDKKITDCEDLTSIL